MTFEELNLIQPITAALKKKGYTEPTPIQERAIPHVLEGRDLLGCAQTGTGKTAAFVLPLLQFYYGTKEHAQAPPKLRALILAPTRELAQQINESIAAYGKNLHPRHAVIFGGVNQRSQVLAIKKGVDILVATPGRLLDLMMQKLVSLDKIDFFVLDEADRMLDMGFIVEVKKILNKLPADKQTLLFSATIPHEIRDLTERLLHDPVRVSVTPTATTPQLVKQAVYFVEKQHKRSLLGHVLADDSIEHALVFTRTKRGAERLAKDLKRSGINAEAIHGDKSQGQRERALSGFKKRSIRVLVATDIAARGIDVERISHVINYEIPDQPETYVHRIGRTGRAGVEGRALSFCALDERPNLQSITKLIRKELEIVAEHPFSQFSPPATKLMTVQPAVARPMVVWRSRHRV